MTQLKLEDFFKEIDTDVLAKSYKKNQLLGLEDDEPKTRANISFHSFKVRKTLDNDDSFEGRLLFNMDSNWLQPDTNKLSAEKSNTFTAGLATIFGQNEESCSVSQDKSFFGNSLSHP